MAISKKISEEELSVLVKEGNELAFQQLYNKYWDKLYIAAYKLLGDSNASEDIVQEIFLDFWNRSSESRITNVRAYLYQAVRFQVSKNIRHMKFSGKREEIIESYSVGNDVEDYIAGKELASQIDKSIDSLPDRCKEIFKLSRHEYLSNKKISEKLGISVNTVETQIKKALKRIRQHVDIVSFWAFLFYLLK